MEGAVDCSLDGTAVAHGDSINAYSEANIIWDATYACTDRLESRKCYNWSLDGSYTNLTCAKGTPENCPADSTYEYSVGHIYDVIQLDHEENAVPTIEIEENNGTYEYTLNVTCNDGTYNESETGPDLVSCDENYTVIGNNCSADSKSTTCGWSIEANEGWNTSDDYIQTWNGSVWLPNKSANYDENPSIDDCRYRCKENYTWNGSSCDANTKAVTCGWSIVSNAAASTAITYTQTWNGIIWTPTTSWWEDQTTCDFNCNANYTWDGDSCEADGRTETCGGTIPANSEWNSSDTYGQIWDGSIWTPSKTVNHSITTSTDDCRYKCSTDYHTEDSGVTCISDTKIVNCGWSIVANAAASTAVTYTQTWNGTIWTPTTSWWEDQTTCDFNCNANYTWDGDSCEADGRTETCGGTLPANSEWNSSDTYGQTWDGSIWVPSKTSNYSITTSIDDCRYSCKTGYHTEDSGVTCISDTKIVTCGWSGVSNAIATTASTYTQTWDWSIWWVTTSRWEDQVICDFDCKENYTWDGDSCEADGRTVTCAGTLPANSEWNTSNTYGQSWNGSIWTPSKTANYNTSGTTDDCRYKCNTSYHTENSGTTCVSDTRACSITNGVWTQTWWWASWWTCTVVSCNTNYSESGDACIADGKTVTCGWAIVANSEWNSSNTYGQTWDGSIWAPSKTANYSITTSTNDCRYRCKTNYTWNGSICEVDTRLTTCWWTISTNKINTTGTTYTQTWNGTSWLPVSKDYTHNLIASECNFVCDTSSISNSSRYYWNWVDCVKLDGNSNFRLSTKTDTSLSFVWDEVTWTQRYYLKNITDNWPRTNKWINLSHTFTWLTSWKEYRIIMVPVMYYNWIQVNGVSITLTILIDCPINTSLVWEICVANTKTVTCGWNIVANSERNSSNTYSQLWNGSIWTPTKTANYSTTTSTNDCRYRCKTNYTWSGSACIANTRTITCSGTIPANSERNSSNTYSQLWNGSIRTPTKTVNYSTTTSTNDCRYRCKTNYTWSGSACVANTRTVTCSGTIPANSERNSSNTYSQLRNGSIRTPTKTVNYSTTTSTNDCRYRCKTNYAWNGNACIADTKTVTCGGILPANSWWNSSNTYGQVWNGSIWTPSKTANYNTSGTTDDCRYKCKTSYHTENTGTTCVSDTRTCTIANGAWSQTWNGNSWNSCVPTSCTTDYYSNGSSCLAVWTSYYSANGSLSRVACTNKPSSSNYTSDGNGTNSCSWWCQTDLYRNGSSCAAVGTAYYSPNSNNTRYTCSNRKPSYSTYSTDGNGGNSCSRWCRTDLYRNGSSCAAVGTAYYSPTKNNTRYACSNRKPTYTTYTTDGNGGNSCNRWCRTDLYRTGSACARVGHGLYSPTRNNSRYRCSNRKPANSYYSADGNGVNSCSRACNSGYVRRNGACRTCASGWSWSNGVCYKTQSNPKVRIWYRAPLWASTANALWIDSGDHYCNQYQRAGSKIARATQNLCGPYRVRFDATWSGTPTGARQKRDFGCVEHGWASSITCKYTP